MANESEKRTALPSVSFRRFSGERSTMGSPDRVYDGAGPFNESLKCRCDAQRGAAPSDGPTDQIRGFLKSHLDENSSSTSLSEFVRATKMKAGTALQINNICVSLTGPAI
jgi:hypothetical protein